MPGDLYWTNVVFLSGFEGGTVVDESALAQTVTLAGSTAASTSQFKYGAKSLAHPASGMASVPDNAAFFSGSSNFTVEGWFYFSAIPASTQNQYLVSQYDAGTATGAAWALYWRYASGGTNRLNFEVDTVGDTSGTNSVIYIAWTPTAATWHHIAVAFDGTTYRAFVDGALLDSSATTYSIYNANSKLSLGALTNSGAANSVLFDGFMDEVRVTAGVARYTAAFTAPTAAFVRGAEPALEPTITEGLGISESATWAYEVVLADALSLAPSWLTAYGSGVNDGVGISAVPIETYVQPVDATDVVNMAWELTPAYGLEVVEGLRLAMVLVATEYANLYATDDMLVGEALVVALPAVLVDTVGVELTQALVDAAVLIEQMGLTETFLPSLLYSKSVSDIIQLTESLLNFFGGELTDGLGVLETLGSVLSAPVSLSDNIAVAPVLTPTLLFHVEATDTVSITPTEVLQAIYSGVVLEDGVQITAAYVSPNGAFTTWAMNTRTAAVTEYRSYEFNSFARLENRYIGATTDGIYDLTGDTDNGEDIVSTIRSGFAQWSGTHLGSIKAAYLATRGDAEFVLRIINPDETSVDYQVLARDMRSTKVHFGKGLRARYFAFELVGIGPDYDLESLEWIPLPVKRRV